MTLGIWFGGANKSVSTVIPIAEQLADEQTDTFFLFVRVCVL